MLYVFPRGTRAIAISDYVRPYADPINVIAGEVVRPDPIRSAETDFMGWAWCVGSDGREGWVPLEWIDRSGAEWQMRRDFSALELDVKKGDELELHFSESGFVFATSGSRTGWVPDAVLALAHS